MRPVGVATHHRPMAPAHPLPARLPAVLRLPPHRSVLRLGPRSRFLGLDPATAVAVDELAAGLPEMLDELAAPVPTAQLVARAVGRGAGAGEAEALLEELVAAGVLVDAADLQWRACRRAESTVVVAGDGPLTVGVALGLARAGVGTVHVETSGTVGDADIGTGLLESDVGRERRGATVGALRRIAQTVVTGPPPQRFAPDLVVLADAAAPDPVRLATLALDGIAHLPVRAREGVGLVGPLVLPGRTACLGCVELHRGAMAPDWPAVAAQLVGRPGLADPACMAATAALGAAQAVLALDGGDHRPPPTLDATLELDPTAGTLFRRVWSPRPECVCGAARRGAARHGPAACAAGRDQVTIGV